MKIAISEETKLELIMRVLPTNKILEGKEKGLNELDINYEKFMNRVSEIETLMFDEEFIKKISEIMGDNNE